MGDGAAGERAFTPLVGNILLVALVVVLGTVVLVVGLTLLDGFGTPTADASFEFEQTSSGIVLRPTTLGTDVIVKLNGKQIDTIDSGEAGKAVQIPTAPGDEISIISRDGQEAVLLRRQVDDRDVIGDFIAYYDFEDSGTPNTLVDQSGNGNDGTIYGNPSYSACGLRFNQANTATDYVKISGLSAPVDVNEFTIAAKFTQYGEGASGDDISQLIEHTWSGNEWFLENEWDAASGNFRGDFAVKYPSHLISTSTTYDLGTEYVFIGTYDGSEFSLYVDGTKVASASYSRQVDMGDMTIARDFESDIQHLNGEVCEVRLYYTAFEDATIERISNAMDS